MIDLKPKLAPEDFSQKLKRFWDLSGQKIHLIEKHYDEARGSPVFTTGGKYSTRDGPNGHKVFNTGLPLFSMMQLVRKRCL